MSVPALVHAGFNRGGVEAIVPMRAVGCDRTAATPGTRGRVGPLRGDGRDRPHSRAGAPGAPVVELRRAAVAAAWSPCARAACARSSDGVTSLEEVARETLE